MLYSAQQRRERERERKHLFTVAKRNTGRSQTEVNDSVYLQDVDKNRWKGQAPVAHTCNPSYSGGRD
jgi:hypothetical protein